MSLVVECGTTQAPATTSIWVLLGTILYYTASSNGAIFRNNTSTMK